MGVGHSRIWVRDLKYSWGSCTPGGTLSFNWRIIQALMIVADYLIVHELAHVLEPNHSKEFWNIVAVHVPSWTKARNWLKQHGAQLEW
jgi:predicted metal-dependent hydrolase